MDLGTFAIKNWYHAFVVIGAAAAGGGAAFDLKNVSGKDAMIFGFGMAAIGFGEWMNHPFQSRHVPGPQGWMIASGHPRSGCITGVALVIVGLGLVGIAAVRFAKTL